MKAMAALWGAGQRGGGLGSMVGWWRVDSRLGCGLMCLTGFGMDWLADLRNGMFAKVGIKHKLSARA